jgi:ribosomal protein S18 acetylase RimI-like enzyme
MTNTLNIRRVTPTDTDLADIAKAVAWVKWADRDYTAASLKEFVSNPDRIYLLSYIDNQIAGVAHAYLLLHPDSRKVMYIDEVDTKPEFRQQGVATALMKEAFSLAAEQGVDEAWLSTEDDNQPAKALYQKLKPDEVEIGPIYTYKVKNGH